MECANLFLLVHLFSNGDVECWPIHVAVQMLNIVRPGSRLGLRVCRFCLHEPWTCCLKDVFAVWWCWLDAGLAGVGAWTRTVHLSGAGSVEPFRAIPIHTRERLSGVCIPNNYVAEE